MYQPKRDIHLLCYRECEPLGPLPLCCLLETCALLKLYMSTCLIMYFFMIMQLFLKEILFAIQYIIA